jgi:type IV pilus assembly protein PilA
MKHIQQGFTLIELMIVVAIVGILAAIALPAYQDYMARAKISEPLARIDAAKVSVAEYIATNGADPADAATAGIDQTATKYIAGVAYGTNGISVTIQGTGTAADTGHIFMAPNDQGVKGGPLVWTCGTDIAAANQKFLPSNCRAAAPTKTITP